MTAPDIAALAKGLSRGERRCLLTWGDPEKPAPIPDSIWHGRLSHLKTVDGLGFILSPLGILVRDYLKENGDG